MTYNTLVVLLGASLLGVACALVGTFAVLKGRALLADAVAHAALPGVVGAFWITGARELPILLAGGLGAGLVGLAALAAMRRHGRTREDSALALVLSVLFGLGIVFSRSIQNTPGGAKAGIDTFILGKTAGIVMADVLIVAGVAATIGLAVVVLYRPLLLSTFDADFGRTIGWPVARFDYLLMALLVVAVIAGLPMAGVVMVAALTIIPPSAARAWTGHLPQMLGLSSLFGIAACALGVYASLQVAQLPSGPSIVLAAGVLFVASALVAPHRGALALAFRRKRFRDDLALRALLRELPAPHEALARRLAAYPGAMRARWIAPQRGLASESPEGLELTEAGRRFLEEGG